MLYSKRRSASLLVTALAVAGCGTFFGPPTDGTGGRGPLPGTPGPGASGGTPDPGVTVAPPAPTAPPGASPTPPATPRPALFRIQAFAGDASGSAGSSRDGETAGASLFSGPAGVSLGPDGTLYVADYQNHVVRKIAGGAVTTVAGWGAFGFAGDGGPARDAQLSRPFGVAAGSDGSLAIADYGNDRVRVIDRSGIITTTVGGGAATPSAGVEATASALAGPAGVAYALDGTLYVAEFIGDRVLRLAPDGSLDIVAGPEEVRRPVAVLPDARGGCWISDFGNNRVRHVDSLGAIRTIAGTGEAGSAGDGGPAAGAQLDGPAALALAPDGTILVADMGNNKIRAIDPDGTIRTVAGSGRKGNAGDGGPALDAELDGPVGLALLGGAPVVADFGNNRLRLLLTE